MINVPVLLIAYNRPDTALQVFEQIRKARPAKFYFAVDGPKDASGLDNILKVRQLKGLVDWPCEVHSLFREKNFGCGHGPAEAISWAFENEEKLIVLEDDCVASLSFFTFCEEMLNKYANDERVTIISGRSHHEGTKFFHNQDYIFSHYAHTWGWATWKRSWSQFDLYMKDFPSWLSVGGAFNVFATNKEGIYYNKWFKLMYDHIEDEVKHTWDGQWMYAFLKNGGLGVIPCYNLIHCIGVGNGTHNGVECLTTRREMPELLRHPKFIIAQSEYESLHFKSHINPHYNIIKRIVNKINQIWGL